MHGPAHDRFVYIEIAVANLDVKTAFEVGADPGLVVNGRPLTAKVREGYQITDLALLTLGETI